MFFYADMLPNDGEYVRIYMAKITGSDRKYRYRREFVPYDWEEGMGTYDLTAAGVYECCVKYFDTSTKKFLRKEREWVIYDGDAFLSIREEDVLPLCKKRSLIKTYFDEIA